MKRERTPEPNTELVTVIKCAPDNGACVTKIVSVHKAAVNRSSRAIARKAVQDIVRNMKLNHAKVQVDLDAYLVKIFSESESGKRKQQQLRGIKRPFTGSRRCLLQSSSGISLPNWDSTWTEVYYNKNNQQTKEIEDETKQ